MATTVVNRKELLSVVRILTQVVGARRRSSFEKTLYLVGRGNTLDIVTVYGQWASIPAEGADMTVGVDAHQLKAALESFKAAQVELTAEGGLLKIAHPATQAVMYLYTSDGAGPEPIGPATPHYIRIPARAFQDALDAVDSLVDSHAPIEFIRHLIVDYTYPRTSAVLAGGSPYVFGKSTVPVVTNLTKSLTVRITLQTAELVKKIAYQYGTQTDTVCIYEPFRKDDPDAWIVVVKIGPFTLYDRIPDASPVDYQRFFDVGDGYIFDLPLAPLQNVLERIVAVAKAAGRQKDRIFCKMTFQARAGKCGIDYTWSDLRITGELPLTCTPTSRDMTATINVAYLLSFVKAMGRFGVQVVRLRGGIGWDRQLMIVEPAYADGLTDQAYTFVPEVRPLQDAADEAA